MAEGLLTAPLPGFFSILPNLGVESNLLAVLGNLTSGGLFVLVFSNSGEMLESFKGLSEVKFHSIINKLVPDLKSHIPGPMSSPIGLPPIPGVIGQER